MAEGLLYYQFTGNEGYTDILLYYILLNMPLLITSIKHEFLLTIDEVELINIKF